MSKLESLYVDRESPEYAFSALAYWMGIVGRIGVIFVALTAIATVVAFDFSFVVNGFFATIISALTLYAASAFKRVSVMDENAPEHLRDAAFRLRDLFRFQAIMFAIQAGLIIIFVIGMRLL